MQPLLDIQNCDLGYAGQTILSGMSLTVSRSEFVAIVGPNGSGKTTLLRSVLGLQKPLSGRILLHSKRIGYVPQHAQLNLGVPVTGREFLDLKQIPAIDSQALDRLLHRLGVNDSKILDKPLQHLSVGQRQRLMVAFALLGQPDLICLDEATDGLDFQAQKNFFSLIKEIQNETHAAVLLVSHDISAVGVQATRAICLNRSILFDGAPNSPEFHSCLHSIYGSDSVIHHHHHH